MLATLAQQTKVLGCVRSDEILCSLLPSIEWQCAGYAKFQTWITYPIFYCTEKITSVKKLLCTRMERFPDFLKCVWAFSYTLYLFPSSAYFPLPGFPLQPFMPRLFHLHCRIRGIKNFEFSIPWAYDKCMDKKASNVHKYSRFLSPEWENRTNLQRKGTVKILQHNTLCRVITSMTL